MTMATCNSKSKIAHYWICALAKMDFHHMTLPVDSLYRTHLSLNWSPRFKCSMWNSSKKEFGYWKVQHFLKSIFSLSTLIEYDSIQSRDEIWKNHITVAIPRDNEEDCQHACNQNQHCQYFIFKETQGINCFFGNVNDPNPMEFVKTLLTGIVTVKEKLMVLDRKWSWNKSWIPLNSFKYEGV